MQPLTHGTPVAIEDIPLTWSDFLITRDKFNNAAAAIVSTRIEYRITPRIINGKTNYFLTTQCSIDRAGTKVQQSFIDNANKAEHQQILNHEKGHLMIALIYHKRFQEKLEAYNFTGAMIEEAYQLYGEINKQIREANILYDQHTNHGINNQQSQWQDSLLTELKKLYGEHSDYFKPVEVALKLAKGTVKIGDPINLGYKSLQPVIEYGFVNNRIIANQVNPAHPIIVDTPYNTQTDSIVYVDGIDFNQDFELEFSFSLHDEKKKNTSGIILGWATSKANFVDSLNTAVAVAPSGTNYFGLQQVKRKRDRLANSYSNNLKDGLHFFSIRKIGSNYHTFIDGRFDTELLFKSPTGQRIFFFIVKKFGSIHGIRFYYL
jgi:hypothetical protein